MKYNLQDNLIILKIINSMFIMNPIGKALPMMNSLTRYLQKTEEHLHDLFFLYLFIEEWTHISPNNDEKMMKKIARIDDDDERHDEWEKKKGGRRSDMEERGEVEFQGYNYHIMCFNF